MMSRKLLVCGLSHFLRSKRVNCAKNWKPQRSLKSEKYIFSRCGTFRTFVAEHGIKATNVEDNENCAQAPVSAERHSPAVAALKELAKRLDEPKQLRSPVTGRSIHVTVASESTATCVNDRVQSEYDLDSLKNMGSNDNSSSNQSLHDLAIQVCHNYRTLPHPSDWTSNDTLSERRNIVEFLAIECSTHRAQIFSAIENYQKQNEDVATTSISTRSSPRLLSQERLRRACTDRYETILSFVLQQNAQLGMQFILALREDLFQLTRWRESLPQHHDHARLSARLKRLDSFIRQLLITWFSPGMIETRRITYEHTSAAIIETIATKEAVHPMRSLEDLKLRLSANRRVFCLFHPLLPDVPLVFVHVALLDEVPSSMNQVLEVSCEQETYSNGRSVAAFYSISNAQSGLAGVGLGEYLIKDAVRLLQAEFPQMTTFCTLSPIPHFRRWMTERITLNQRNSLAGDQILSNEDALLVAKALGCSPNDAPHQLLAELEKGPVAVRHQVLKPILLRVAARYICLEKHHGKPIDAVARFHVGNGAQVYRLNYLADASRKGFHNSFGLMINYKYNLQTITRHKNEYEKEYRIPICVDVMELL